MAGARTTLLVCIQGVCCWVIRHCEEDPLGAIFIGIPTPPRGTEEKLVRPVGSKDTVCPGIGWGGLLNPLDMPCMEGPCVKGGRD